MKIILTKHAKQRLIERKINIDDVKETIDFPEYTIKKNGKVEAYKRFGNNTLKVVYAEEGKFKKIITLILK
jgi:hypothetical protein